MKILSIGNSFSEDAQHYLHDIASKSGEEIECSNLFVGGCSLKQHYEFLNRSRVYVLFKNGIRLEKYTDAVSALKSDTWDYVTLQQVSSSAAHYETYMPYIQMLADTVRTYAPNAKILLHQTWAYEDGSQKLLEGAKFSTAIEMFNNVERAYLLAAEQIKADGIIPSGKAMLLTAIDGNIKVHRDCSHAAWGIGRYLLGLTWYAYLTGKLATAVPIELDEYVSDTDINIAVNAVNKAVLG